MLFCLHLCLLYALCTALWLVQTHYKCAFINKCYLLTCLLVRLRPGFQFFEASAKDHINVKQVFERLVDIICEKMSESLEGDSGMLGNQRNMAMQDGPPDGQGGCACWTVDLHTQPGRTTRRTHKNTSTQTHSFFCPTSHTSITRHPIINNTLSFILLARSLPPSLSLLSLSLSLSQSLSLCFDVFSQTVISFVILSQTHAATWTHTHTAIPSIVLCGLNTLSSAVHHDVVIVFAGNSCSGRGV